MRIVLRFNPGQLPRLIHGWNLDDGAAAKDHNAGSIAATLIDAEGATVVAVSDSTGGIHNPDGLDIKRVIAWKKEHGTVQGFPGSTDVSNAEGLEVDCDILIPAALEHQITEDNAGRISCRLVVEAANGPITPEADEILRDRGIPVLPDVLANAGGVTVSYFEWVQDRMGFFWNEDTVNTRLLEIMVSSFNDVVSFANKYQVNTRQAAYMLAIDRVAYDTRLRGIYA